jgi:pimeloyl-ACP methyl ester carboxylesterase
MATLFFERIAVEVDGEGDAVVMIHGLGGTSNSWTPLTAAFLRHKRVRLDLPGSGRSYRVEGPLSIARFVQATLRAMAAAAVERAHIVAHSMGTIVAAHLAAGQPRAVRSLALFGPLLAPPEPMRAPIRARGEKARAEGTAGMQAIADALVQAATSAETKARRPAAVAFVRESLMRQDAEGYARSCEALAEAQSADTTRIECPATRTASRRRRRCA